MFQRVCRRFFSRLAFSRLPHSAIPPPLSLLLRLYTVNAIPPFCVRDGQTLILVILREKRELKEQTSLRFTDFPSLYACSESILTNLIGSGHNLLCLQSHSKSECRWTRPEVVISLTDQKERGFWGQECSLCCSWESIKLLCLKVGNCISFHLARKK